MTPTRTPFSTISANANEGDSALRQRNTENVQNQKNQLAQEHAKALDRRTQLDLWKQQKQGVDKNGQRMNAKKNIAVDRENTAPAPPNIANNGNATKQVLKHVALPSKRKNQRSPPFASGTNKRSFRIFSDGKVDGTKVKKMGASRPERNLADGNSKESIVSDLNRKVEDLQHMVTKLKRQLERERQKTNRSAAESQVLMQRISLLTEQNEEYEEELDRQQDEMDMKTGEVKYFGTLYELAGIELQEEQQISKKNVDDLKQELVHSQDKVRLLEKELDQRNLELEQWKAKSLK